MLSMIEADISAYEAAAQRHANGFWVFAFIAGVIWYFWGLGTGCIIAGMLALLLGYYSIKSTAKAGKLRRAHAVLKARG